MEEAYDSSPSFVEPEKGDRDLFRYILDTSPELFELKNSLMGLEFMPTEGKYVKVGRQLLNEEGIQKVMSLFFSLRVNRITTLANLDEDRILMMTRNTARNIRLQMAKNFKNWNIDKGDMSSIKDLVVDTVYTTLTRPLEQGERNLIRDTLTRKETIPISTGEEKGSWMPSLTGGNQ